MFPGEGRELDFEFYDFFRKNHGLLKERTLKNNIQTIQHLLAFVEPPEMIGIEESTMECSKYFTSIKCTSVTGRALKIKVGDF